MSIADFATLSNCYAATPRHEHLGRLVDLARPVSRKVRHLHGLKLHFHGAMGGPGAGSFIVYRCQEAIHDKTRSRAVEHGRRMVLFGEPSARPVVYGG